MLNAEKADRLSRESFRHPKSLGGMTQAKLSSRARRWGFEVRGSGPTSFTRATLAASRRENRQIGYPQ